MRNSAEESSGSQGNSAFTGSNKKGGGATGASTVTQQEDGSSQSQNWIGGAYNELSNFGYWLVNHANKDISQQGGWRANAWGFFAEDGINAFNQLSNGEYGDAILSVMMAVAKPLKVADRAHDAYSDGQKVTKSGGKALRPYTNRPHGALRRYDQKSTKKSISAFIFSTCCRNGFAKVESEKRGRYQAAI